MEKGEYLEWRLGALGVDGGNVFGNLFLYSLLAAQNLDFLASAAGRVDVEAARLIRTAQQMVRTRVDVMARLSLFGTAGKNSVTGREMYFGVRGFFPPFGEIDIATSEDAGAAFKADPGEIADDLDRLYKAQDRNGQVVKMEGALFENLRRILAAEDAFYHADLDAIVNAVSEEQERQAKALQKAATTICAYLYTAVRILRDKTLGGWGRFICSCCGTFMAELAEGDKGPAPCWVCGAPASLIIDYPFSMRGTNADNIYKEMGV